MQSTDDTGRKMVEANAEALGQQERGGTLSEEMSRKLEQMILAGDLKPGERLDEASLASEFSVSRTPVREAIQRLAATGIVDLQPRKGGAIVAMLPMARLISMFELMAEYDIISARLAARRANEDERSNLEEIVQRSGKASSDPPAYNLLNREFHWSIYSATHNEVLKAQAIRTWKQLQPYRNFRLEQPERLLESLEQHKKILAAILEFDAERAEREMRHHVRVGGLIADFILTMPGGAAQK